MLLAKAFQAVFITAVCHTDCNTFDVIVFAAVAPAKFLYESLAIFCPSLNTYVFIC